MDAIKSQKLGMNVSTAKSRLTKDLLFMFVKAAGHKCFRCGGELDRESFSIEHTEDWFNAEDPVKTFFDVTKIAFSHQPCNSGAASRPYKKWDSPQERDAAWQKSKYQATPVDERQRKRREKYRRSGW